MRGATCGSRRAVRRSLCRVARRVAWLLSSRPPRLTARKPVSSGRCWFVLRGWCPRSGHLASCLVVPALWSDHPSTFGSFDRPLGTDGSHDGHVLQPCSRGRRLGAPNAEQAPGSQTALQCRLQLPCRALLPYRSSPENVLFPEFTHAVLLQPFLETGRIQTAES